MMNRRTPSATVSAIARVLAGVLVLGASAAHAQSANSARATPLDGTFTPASGGGAVDPAAENVHCTGDVQLGTKAVNDPSLPPGIVLSVDATGLTCAGQATRGKYVTDSSETLTRLLVPSDVVQTTLAFHKATPNGFLTAKTALLTLNLTYDPVTGALTGATATLGDFVAP
jgi:hypothetical protein